MQVDKISDVVALLKNGLIAKQESVVIPYNKFSKLLLKILYRECYIDEFKLFRNCNHRFCFLVNLKNVGRDKDSVAWRIERVSTPGNRVYCTKKHVVRLSKKHLFGIVSTNFGCITFMEAARLGVGGELILTIN